MTKKQYLKKMSKHNEAFAKLWEKIVTDTNEFIETNPKESSYYYMQGSKVDALIEYLSLSGAWIMDRLNGKSGVTGNKNYRGSLTKKIRRALGYIY